MSIGLDRALALAVLADDKISQALLRCVPLYMPGEGDGVHVAWRGRWGDTTMATTMCGRTARGGRVCGPATCSDCLRLYAEPNFVLRAPDEVLPWES